MARVENGEGNLARPGQVDVWLTSLSDISDSDQLELLWLLSESERTKWERFLTKDSRLQYLATRALVRTTLSRYAAVSPQAWHFETNDYGRPHIIQPQMHRSLQFNLSNTKGLVACAVSRECEVGIDVENFERTLDVDALAPSVFAPSELADLQKAPPEDRLDLFLSYWTLKESYIKARGMGLSHPLDAFWFEFSGSSPFLFVTDRCSDIATRWRFYQYAPTHTHKMAVAVAPPDGVEPSIRLIWVTLT
jgi:4'-phosphopantetheinyl transferase